MGVGNIAKEMKIEDLPGDLPAVAQIIGMENTMEIWKIFSGNALHFPRKLPKAFCARYVRNNYDGSNKLKLCHDLGIGGRTFQNYLNTKGHFDQTDLFSGSSSDPK